MLSDHYRKIRKKWNEDSAPIETEVDSLEDSEKRFSKLYSQYIQKTEANSSKYKKQ